MADEVSGTINVAVIYKMAGGSSSKTTSTKDTSAKKKHASQMFDITKHLKTITGAVTIGAVVKQSKIISGFLGAFLQLMGALVDIFLMPFIPLLIPVIKAMGGLVKWFMKFMDDPGAALKEAIVAFKNLVVDSAKGLWDNLINFSWDGFFGAINLKTITENALRVGVGGLGLLGVFTATSKGPDLIMKSFFGLSSGVGNILFSQKGLLGKLFGTDGKLASLLRALGMWSEPNGLGQPSGLPGTGTKGGTPDSKAKPKTLPKTGGGRGTPGNNTGRNIPPGAGKLPRAAGAMARGVNRLLGVWPLIMYTVMKASEEPGWVRPPGWTQDLEDFAQYARTLSAEHQTELAALMRSVPEGQQAAWAKAFMDGTLTTTEDGFTPTALVMPANNRPKSQPSASNGGYAGPSFSDLDIILNKNENGIWEVENSSGLFTTSTN